MPIIQVEMLKGRTVEQKRAMAKKVTEALVETVGCKTEAVKIIIREMEFEDYAQGGVLHCDINK
ncbi:4-oxalocrotonate tautomerase [Gudongella oleilytica]|jgi:4-oxalocrotonate tautomerase|uniref:4-oxalocrotonate tautomerase n=1 Tax=Gudongella oleilytica TaxID=1582259 RepID=UPI000FF8B7A6|nr:4-oxalocrotonate tautomerase [Gudongella oleilytica]